MEDFWMRLAIAGWAAFVIMVALYVSGPKRGSGYPPSVTPTRARRGGNSPPGKPRID